MNYYNDNDSFSVKWLKALIAEGLIPKGDVDDRSITEIKPNELDGYTQCHFFAGIGGWPYALRLSGWPEDRPVWTGSCPCQPFSVAGQGKGIEDERHLWPAFRWLIAQKRPATIFGEQVASSDGREWLSGVRLDLETMGYEVGAADLCAAGVGAPHIRHRLFWVAYSKQQGLEGHAGDGDRRNQSGRQQTDKAGPTAKGGAAGFWSNSIPIPCADGKWRRVPGRVVNTEGTHGGDGGRPGESKGKNDTAEKSRESHGGLSESGIGRETGSTKINIEIEPAIFDLLSDGVSAILGPVWSKGCANLKAEVFNYAEETKTRPGKILQALWEKALQKTIQRNAGRHGAFSETEILFIALCQLSRDQEQEIGAAAQNILEAQERTVRILWENAPKPAISSCPSHQRKLEGSPARESSDAVRWMPSKTAHKASGNMQGLWGKGQKTQDVSETFSKMEKIWRSVANKDMRWSKKMEDCKGWSDGLTLFPLSTSFPGRVGLLRGAGNAIVPQVAAAFIKACFDD
jgi:DNA (cytosine-5)-methyltransferase 1